MQTYKTGQKEVIGGATEAGGSVRWHVLPEDSTAFRNSMGSVVVDGKTVKALIEGFLKDTVSERLSQLRAFGGIDKEIERRIELTVKSAMQDAEVAFRAEAIRLAKLKAEEVVSRLNWGIQISATAT